MAPKLNPVGATGNLPPNVDDAGALGPLPNSEAAGVDVSPNLNPFVSGLCSPLVCPKLKLTVEEGASVAAAGAAPKLKDGAALAFSAGLMDPNMDSALIGSGSFMPSTLRKPDLARSAIDGFLVPQLLVLLLTWVHQN